MSAPIGVGLVGLGRLAQVTHLPSLLAMPNARVVGLCDAQPGRAARIAAEHGLTTVAIESDYRTLLADPAVEAVVVSLPNRFHAPVTLAALAAGKHVLCEKPPAMSAAEARQMLEAARANRRLLVYGLQNRLRDDVRHLKALIEAGTLGEIYYGKATTLRWRGAPQGWFTSKALAGGGALIDIGVHVLDMTLFLMGYPRATRVSAATYNHFGSRVPFGIRPWQAADIYEGVGQQPIFDVEDLATAMIRFENGAVLQLESAWSLHIGQDGTQTNVSLYGSQGGADLLPQLRVSTEVGGQLAAVTPVVRGDGVKEHTRGMQRFIEAIERGEIGSQAAEQGVALMAVMDAIYASAASGAEVAVEA